MMYQALNCKLLNGCISPSHLWLLADSPAEFGEAWTDGVSEICRILTPNNWKMYWLRCAELCLVCMVEAIPVTAFYCSFYSWGESLCWQVTLSRSWHNNEFGSVVTMYPGQIAREGSISIVTVELDGESSCDSVSVCTGLQGTTN